MTSAEIASAPSWGEWLLNHSPLILLAIQNLILIVTVYVAYHAIKKHGIEAKIDRENDLEIARKTNSINYLIKFKSDPEYINSVNTINRLRRAKVSPDSLLSTNGKRENCDKRTKRIQDLNACNNYLKKLATISVGVSNNIFDDKIFKNNMYSTAIEFYSYLTPLIKEYRIDADSRIRERKFVKSGTIYEEVESLVERWKEQGYN